MTDQNQPKPEPEPAAVQAHGRFQRWLDLVLANATTQEAATKREQAADQQAFDLGDEEPKQS